LLPAAGQAKDERSAFFLESFRSLYTNIRLLSTRQPIHSLVIGSAVPGDGKSTLAIYLAQTAASMGQRVLLVDADLRRPQLHVRLGLPNDRGLSDVITTDLSLNDAIVRSSVEDNLFVLTAGQPTSDSIKLLSSGKMQYLMEQFQAFFDLVIYDTPPLLGLADGNILAANTDGIILVVGLQKTDRSLLTKSLESLKISGASVLGVVANGIKGYTPDSYSSYQRQYQTIEQ
jgi:capsular exopolysaccharide synthesis family protein